MLTLAVTGASADAQSPGPAVRLTGVHQPGSTAATGSLPQAIVFDPVPLAGAPQQLVATFSKGAVTGTPVASLHYGHDFSLGPVSCADQTCSVTLTFSPTLPGARPDALFLTSGAQRVATVPVSGTGQSPFAVLQPGSLASAASSSIAAAVLDENGTFYALASDGDTVTSTDASGRSAVLPLTDLASAHGIAIDGAGVLYLLPRGADRTLITYDTVQGLQGSLPLPVAADLLDSIAIGAAGDLYAVSTTSRLLYRLAPNGEVSSTSLGSEGEVKSASSPAISAVALASRSAQKPVTSTAQPQSETQSPVASFAALAVDAAGTLYASAAGATVELAAPEFTSAIGKLPAALAVGSDGTLLVPAAQGIARLDRTQTGLDFGSVVPSVDAEPQVALLYNAGNQPLTLFDLRVAGAGFSIASTPRNTCTAGVVVAPGSSCQIAVGLLAPHSGSASGTLAITSDSLNRAGSMLQVPVKANTAGSLAVLTPNALIFPNTTVNVASAAQTITLSNPGTAALNISGVALTGAASGSYSLTTTCVSATVTSLAAGASCTIAVTFKPLTAVSQSAVVSVNDDLNGVAGSTQTATLIGLGVAAPAPVITYYAVSANGASTASSTTSSTIGTLSFGGTNPVLSIPSGAAGTYAGTITLTNSGNAVLTISTLSLVLTGTSTVLPYTQTNNCPSTLAVGASCLVTVTFVPPAGVGATYTAGIVLADNAANSPQVFGISGITTTPDFTISASTNSLAIPSTGGSGQIVISSVPDPGPFPSPIGLTVFGMPQAATYTFSPATISSVTGPGTSTLTVTLPTYKNIVLSSLEKPSMLRLTSLPAAACLLAGLFFGRRRKQLPRLTRAVQVLLLALLGLTATSMSGCGSSGVPVSGGVAPGTYYLTITGSSSNGIILSSPAVHQVVVALHVQ
jgi:hypothetical protein